MSDKIDNYMEETKPLFRLLRTEAFRFIIVRYNHYSLVSRLLEDLSRIFPERPHNTIDARNTNYRLLVDSYYKAAKGFFFIENFDEILANPEIYSGLNQRRDKLAMYPIALIVFISSSTDELFARQVMEKMPDLWSFRSLMLDLKVDVAHLTQSENRNQYIASELLDSSTSTLGGNNPEEKEKELNRLLKRVTEIPENEISLLKATYEQIAKLYVNLNSYHESIEFYLKIEKIEIEIGDKYGLGFTYNNLGLIYSNISEWDNALACYIKSETIRNEVGDKGGLGINYNNIGQIYNKKGELDEALKNYLKAEKIFKEVGDKGSLGAIYNNIGQIYNGKGEWNKALKYNLKAETIRNEVGDKGGLGITCNNIGAIYFNIGEFDNALGYFLKSETIFDEKGDKTGIGHAYNNIGGIYYKKGELDKSLEYSQKSETIFKEMGNEAGLVLTYFNIGAVLTKKGNLKQGNNYIILAGFIATNHGMKGELSQISWAIDPIIQELGQEKFMEEGQRLYDQIVNPKKEL